MWVGIPEARPMPMMKAIVKDVIRPVRERLKMAGLEVVFG